jgi:hypothetical protein
MMSKTILQSCRNGFDALRFLVIMFGQTYVPSVRPDIPSTRDKLPNLPSANTFQVRSKSSKTSRLLRPVTNHNSRIGCALMHIYPRNAPAAIPYTKNASLASPMGRDPRGFARRKLFLRSTRGRRGRKATMLRCLGASVRIALA